MTRRIASYDSRAPMPVRLELHSFSLHLSIADAHQLREELAGVLMQADPPEPSTRPDAPLPKRISSADKLSAVRLPERGLDERVQAELEKGRGEG